MKPRAFRTALDLLGVFCVLVLASCSPPAATEGEKAVDTAFLAKRGNELFARGDPVGAEQALRAAIAIDERVRGRAYPPALRSRKVLLIILKSEGKHVEAMKIATPLEEDCQQVFGPDHYETQAVRKLRKEITTAQAEKKEAAAPAPPASEEEKADESAALAARAEELLRNGVFEGAEESWRAVLAGRERTLGADHPETLKARSYLAQIFVVMNRWAEAEREERKVLAVRERTLGAEHPDTLASRAKLAGLLEAQDMITEAERHYQAVLALRERTLGGEHPDTLASRESLAGFLHRQGSHAEAEREARAALATRERVQGPAHSDVFWSCFNLAGNLVSQQRLPEALELARRAEAGLTRALGAGDPRTQRAVKLREKIEAAMARK